MNEFVFAPVHELSGMLVAGELSAVALIEAYLARIEAYEPSLRSLVSTYGSEAREAAHAADRAMAGGYRLSPFHGLPVVIKDNVDIAGRVTTCGSKHWEQRVPERTADLVERLTQAGLIVLGKAHSVEFAMGSFGTNRHMGTPRNPWDRVQHRAPGGSSSGTAVAVAAALSPWGIGTDTGGSVRIPASWCGVTGLKTTPGRVSMRGVLPLSNTLDTPGPICRDVEDCALLFGLMREGTGRADSVMPHLKRGVRGLLLARLPAQALDGVASEVLAAYRDSLEVLERLGAGIVEVQMTCSLDEIGERMARIIGAEGYANVGHLVEDLSLPIDDDIRPRILLGKDMLTAEYLKTLREREEHTREWNRSMAGVDALVLPTTLTAAPLLHEIDQNVPASTLTRPVNYFGWCAMAVPNGFTGEGLPTSLQIACPGFEEHMATRIAWAYEQATQWRYRRPSL